MNTTNRMITILAVVAVGIISVALVSAAFVSSDANKKGNTKTIDFALYWDQRCTNRTGTLKWGNLGPNTTKSLTVYIKNTGTIPVRLSLKTANWNPTTAQNYVTLTWNRENSILNRASYTKATLTLAVSSETPNLTEFSFDITITAGQTRS